MIRVEKLNSSDMNALRDAVTLACGRAVNLHYTDPLWKRLSDQFEWPSVWPVVTPSGYITGEVAEAGGRYLTIATDWEAVVDADHAAEAGWTIDREEGTATPPYDNSLDD